MIQPFLKSAFFLLILLAVAFEVFADILFKKWALTDRFVYIAIGTIVYIASTISWAFSLKYEYLSKAITVFSVLNLAILILVGVFFFKEDLSLWNKLGLLFGVASVVLLQI